jgi:hypothetical protein
MESLAEAFDQPLNTEAHRSLIEDCWIGGSDICLRYRLGRLINRNLFRDSHEVVAVHLQRYFAKLGYKKGSIVARDLQTWSAFADILKHHLSETLDLNEKKSKRLSVLEAALKNPDMTDAELAKAAKTTEKQVARIPDVTLIRKAWTMRADRDDLS